jgi:hypothetical protein
VKRRIAATAVAATTLVALFVGTSAAAPTQVVGTVGPGESIDFRLVGPGTSRVLTGVGFVGTKAVVMKLKKGSYRFFCAPHADDMHGAFAVR